MNGDPGGSVRAVESAPGAVIADSARAVSQVAAVDRAGAVTPLADTERAGAVTPLADTERAGAAAPLADTERAEAAAPLADTERAGAAALADGTDRAAVAHGVSDRVASSVVDAVILERAAGVLRLVLDRTRGRAPADDPALVETLLDGTAPEAARLHAARRLGLDPTVPARALAPLDERPRVVPAGTQADAVGRLGVGPCVPVLELPRSWAEARTALRFTAEGTPQDPGPRVVHAEELGGIALLADLVVPGAEPPSDVRALDAAAASTPWLAATLHAVAATASLRAAASEINVHHSTLQDRLAHAEHLLGWPVRTPQGRLRLQLALTMRRLARAQPPPSGWERLSGRGPVRGSGA
ncbi:helix-turn-helix domain-containing protein [Streptomyces sp. URMC 128]|uniref:helix-turn-helix domain-containing protein n=1 Tax=Streptomyces sp. URMC 128 TaxID=3423404 RepID=UPI003F1DC049